MENGDEYLNKNPSFIFTIEKLGLLFQVVFKVLEILHACCFQLNYLKIRFFLLSNF